MHSLGLFAFCNPSSITKSTKFSELENVDLTSDLLVSTLNNMKSNGDINRWNSTLLEPYAVTPLDLYTQTRVTWQSSDLLKDILKSSSQENVPVKSSFIGISLISVIIAAIGIPLLPISDQTLRNILEGIFLFMPFILIIINVISPNIFQSKETYKKDIERKCTHEAGHLIAGYCCGIPVLSYDVRDEQYQTVMEYPITDNLRRTGNLLIVCFAGIIAEYLRFGDAKGGGADLPLAYNIIQSSKDEYKKLSYDEILRWSLLKSIYILRTNRDALDEVSNLLYNNEPIHLILEKIEELFV